VYIGAPGGLTRVRCIDDNFTSRAGLDLRAEAGTTYYFMVGVCCRNGRDGQDFESPLLLQFHMREPLRIEQVTIADTGSVDRADGDAHLTASGECNYDADWSRWDAQLRQRVGDIFVARGRTWTRATCQAPPSARSVTLSPRGEIAFAEGPATTSMVLIACAEETGTCTRARITSDVFLAYP
jgi:hypothetical protein